MEIYSHLQSVNGNFDNLLILPTACLLNEHCCLVGTKIDILETSITTVAKCIHRPSFSPSCSFYEITSYIIINI